MTTLLRSFIARRALRWLSAFDALLAAILLALLWPDAAPLWIAAICFAAAWLLQKAMGGFANAPFHPALAAFALAFVGGAIPDAEPTLPAHIALVLMALDRLYSPITLRGKLLQSMAIAMAACTLWWLDAPLAAWCCSLLALQFLPPWIDRLTLPRIAHPA